MPDTAKLPAAEVHGTLPEVHLEVRQGSRTTPYPFNQVAFLIGTVPGCDLRVPGADLPALLCLLARHPGGLKLRKLAPTQVLLVNGKTVASAELVDGDRITLGALDIFARVQISDSQQMQARNSQEKPNDQDSRECASAPGRAAGPRPEDQAADIERQRQELAGHRQELADIRRQLYERYQERRDRLAGLQEAVDRAARKVQERKRLLEAEEQNMHLRKQADAQREADLSRRAAELESERRRLEDERRTFALGEAKSHADLDSKLAELGRREEALSGERRDVDARIKHYQVDLLRLDRLQGSVEQRDKDLVGKEEAFAQKLSQLQTDSADLEAEVQRLDAWRSELTESAERLAKQETEQHATEARLDQRSAALEGQQATLAALRSRVERMREEFRQQEQQLAEERHRQGQTAQELEQQRQSLEQMRVEIQSEHDSRDQERTALLARSAMLDAALANLKEAEAKAREADAGLQERCRALEERERVHAEAEGTLEGRLEQLSESQKSLDEERSTLRERTLVLAQAEQAREALQEQLRRRGEELAQKQKSLGEKMQDVEAQTAGLDARRAEMQRQQQEAHTELDKLRADLDRQAGQIQQTQEDLQNKQAHQRQQFEQLQSLGKDVAAERKSLAQDRLALKLTQQAARDAHLAAKTEFESIRADALALHQRLPELELHAGTTLERLTHAREQLRDHLAELHGYVHACQDDLDQLRVRIQKDEASLQEQEQSLRRGQEDHRLAMVAFRQQLIGWQGQIADMKRVLASDETRLERKQAQVAEQVRELDQTTEKLARQAEELQHQQHEVAGRRVEMDRHLVDMREWYRRKLRDLAGIDLADELIEADLVDEKQVVPGPWKAGPPQTVGITIPDDEALIPIGRNILSLTEPVDAGDRNLGDTLAHLGLVDAETLTALLVEARRQRRSLRQVLLAGGVITVYQLALIEASQLDRLMLGPVRVIDRLRVSHSESIYRVFDPRSGQEAVLRHLSEAEMKDATHPDEYRQRFQKAIIDDANIARTLEVVDIAGRPAVLQEWLCGLPSSDWPPLAAAPGVCFRLLTQAALGLSSIHKAGGAHGQLSEASLFLTAQGVLKITGLGEPPWISGVEEQADPLADLQALGRIASNWCTPAGVRKGAKTKPLPESLVSILCRLNGERDAGHQSAAELLGDLDHAGTHLPANTEAWERLLRYIGEHGTPEALLRRSA